jgi:hypothetical protein
LTIAFFGDGLLSCSLQREQHESEAARQKQLAANILERGHSASSLIC